MAKQPVESALASVLAEQAEPSLVIDTAQGMLVGANAAGSKLWGLTATGPSAAVVLDSAMPGLRTLRDRLAAQQLGPGLTIPLTLWTHRGPLSRIFHVRAVPQAAQPSLVLLSLADASKAPTVVPATAVPPVAPERRYRLVVDAASAPSGSEPRASANDAATLQEIARRIREGVVSSVATTSRDERRTSSMSSAPQPAVAVATTPSAIQSDTLAKIAHELRSPLAAIITLSEAITQERFGPLPHERYRGYVHDILDSARHGLTVLDGMLDAQALATGTPELVFADLDLNAEVEASLATMLPLAERSGARIEAALTTSLPRVIADRRSVRQMLINLVGNSLKHGDPNVRIKVTTGYELAGTAWILVEDNGPGFAAAHGGAGPSRPPRPGAGLGLPLTRKLAQANGADLTIDSAAGKGARARIVFPRDRTVPV